MKIQPPPYSEDSKQNILKNEAIKNVFTADRRHSDPVNKCGNVFGTVNVVWQVYLCTNVCQRSHAFFFFFYTHGLASITAYVTCTQTMNTGTSLWNDYVHVFVSPTKDLGHNGTSIASFCGVFT